MQLYRIDTDVVYSELVLAIQLGTSSDHELVVCNVGICGPVVSVQDTVLGHVVDCLPAG